MNETGASDLHLMESNVCATYYISWVTPEIIVFTIQNDMCRIKASQKVCV